jgi:hypothetical protein
MNKKDMLRKKAKGRLATDVKAPVLAVVLKEKAGGELKRITLEIKSDMNELQDIAEWWKAKKERVAELKQNIIEKLMYVRNNRKKLLGGRTFEEYLSNDIGISKGYFYEQIQAYNVCAEHKRLDLYKEVDPRVLVNIAREKDPEKQKKLIAKAPSLSRDYFKKVRPPDFSEKEGEDPFTAMISREDLTIKVADKSILKQIESLLKANGIKVEYV